MALGFIPLWGFGDYELGGSTKVLILLELLVMEIMITMKVTRGNKSMIAGYERLLTHQPSGIRDSRNRSIRCGSDATQPVPAFSLSAGACCTLFPTSISDSLFFVNTMLQTRKLERSVSGLKEAMIYNAIECAIALGVSFFINFSIVAGSNIAAIVVLFVWTVHSPCYYSPNSAVSASTFYYRDDIGLNNASAALEDLLRHP